MSTYDVSGAARDGIPNCSREEGASHVCVSARARGQDVEEEDDVDLHAS
jgi:hypothetical protein